MGRGLAAMVIGSIFAIDEFLSYRRENTYLSGVMWGHQSETVNLSFGTVF